MRSMRPISVDSDYEESSSSAKPSRDFVSRAEDRAGCPLPIVAPEVIPFIMNQYPKAPKGTVQRIDTLPTGARRFFRVKSCLAEVEDTARRESEVRSAQKEKETDILQSAVEKEKEIDHSFEELSNKPQFLPFQPSKYPEVFVDVPRQTAMDHWLEMKSVAMEALRKYDTSF